MEFLIVEDNRGDHHWTLLGHDGNSLARSPSFAPYRDAETAADVAAARDDTDAERWVDEGGRFSREGVGEARAQDPVIEPRVPGVRPRPSGQNRPESQADSYTRTRAEPLTRAEILTTSIERGRL